MQQKHVITTVIENKQYINYLVVTQ